MKYLIGVWAFLRWCISRFRFGHLGFLSRVQSPLKIDGGHNIFIGRHVIIQYKTWLAAVPLTGATSKLIIEDGCIIGHFNHIYSTHSIIIRKNVLIADKVYITDNIHGYDRVDLPVMQQPIIQKGKVEIGEGSWLGENVCVIGATIGKHCVVGANSVVTKDLPDYTVAVGAPAKVIKRYSFDSERWEEV